MCSPSTTSRDCAIGFPTRLCRLATGGGFAVRQLYTDQDEVLFDAARPVILNGIEDIVARPDLADRALFLTLEPIPEDRRRPEAELWTAFEVERPRILGALARRCGRGSEASARDAPGDAAAHGRLRAVGDGLRDGACGPPAPSGPHTPATAMRR